MWEFPQAKFDVVDVSSLFSMSHSSMPQVLHTLRHNSACSFSITVVVKCTKMIRDCPVIKLSIKCGCFSMEEKTFHNVTIASMR